jgi:hypothetical protein
MNKMVESILERVAGWPEEALAAAMRESLAQAKRLCPTIK